MLSKIAFMVPVAALGLATTSRPASADVAVRAQVTVNGGGASFTASLEPYGRWVDEPRYGSVFVPDDRSFVPYSRGHWTDGDAGMTWVSDAPFGDVTEHHGRWAQSAQGWVWIPGDEYAPAWVEWRDSGDAVGWAPLGPDGRGARQATAWRFVPERSLHERRLSRHYVSAVNRYPRARTFDPRERFAAQRRAEDAQRRAEDAQRRDEDAQRRAGLNDRHSEQERRDAQAQRRAQQQQRRHEQMMRRGGPGADPAADRRDRERMLRDIEREHRAEAAARRDGFAR